MLDLPRIRYFSDYYHYIVGLIDRSNIVINRSTLGKSTGVRARATTVGDIYAPDVSGFPDESAQPFDENNGLIFKDGSFLRFLERVQLDVVLGRECLHTHTTINALSKIFSFVLILKNYQLQTLSVNHNIMSIQARSRNFIFHLFPSTLTLC